MRRYIVAGAPGAGKTTLLAELAQRGYPVVAEAATDVIAAAQAAGVDRPWEQPDFVARVVRLQRDRQLAAAPAVCRAQLFDRSPVCSLALAEFLGVPVPAELTAETARIIRDQVYQRTVFFACDLGFVEPTPARQISHADSLQFAELHRWHYLRLGFALVDLPRVSVVTRAALVERTLRSSIP